MLVCSSTLTPKLRRKTQPERHTVLEVPPQKIRRHNRSQRRIWLRVSQMSNSERFGESQGSTGPWSRNAELSSLLDSRLVLASQKCQQSQGSGGSWSRNAELSSVWSSRLKSVNSLRVRGGRGRANLLSAAVPDPSFAMPLKDKANKRKTYLEKLYFVC